MISECRREDSDADWKEVRESLESTSCSGIASESLLDMSEDHNEVTDARESIERCPMIS